MRKITRSARTRLTSVIVVMAITQGCNDTVSPARVVTDGVALTQAQFSAWSVAASIETVPGTHPNFNTPSNDGCPFVSRDGKTFYMASNRTGTMGGLDIWVSTRENESAGWSEPVNVESINSTADDFCPTISRDGHLFYFVSRRSGGCGQGDIYVSRRRSDSDFEQPELLPCDASAPYDAVNSPFDEFSPFPLPQAWTGPVLYFSSFRPAGFAADGATADSDIYMSESHGGIFGQAQLVAGVNSDVDDGQPNVRADGQEIFFYSTRVIPGVSLGAADLYSATRESNSQPWSGVANLGANVNSNAGETRPSLSWDGHTLYFGSTRAGSNDIYFTTRVRQP